MTIKCFPMKSYKTIASLLIGLSLAALSCSVSQVKNTLINKNLNYDLTDSIAITLDFDYDTVWFATKTRDMYNLEEDTLDKLSKEKFIVNDSNRQAEYHLKITEYNYDERSDTSCIKDNDGITHCVPTTGYNFKLRAELTNLQNQEVVKIKGDNSSWSEARLSLLFGTVSEVGRLSVYDVCNQGLHVLTKRSIREILEQKQPNSTAKK